MENSLLLSIIVPVYNTGQYLTRCIESILQQNYKNLEIIIVDDGSTDNSLTICESFLAIDARIKLIKNSHKGAVYARKYGVNIAHGKYLTFVDSDDWLDNDYYDLFIEYANKFEYDVICGGLIEEYETGKQIYEDCYVNDVLYTGRQVRDALSKEMFCDANSFRQKLSPSLNNKVFKSGVLDDIFSITNDAITVGEDALLVYTSISRCKTIYIIKNHCKYHYRKTNYLSLTHKFTEDYWSRIDLFCQNVDYALVALKLQNMQYQYDLYKLYLYLRKLIKDCNTAKTLEYARENVSSQIFHKIIARISIKNLDCSTSYKMLLICFKHKLIISAYFLLKLAKIKMFIKSLYSQKKIKNVMNCCNYQRNNQTWKMQQ